MNNEKIREVPPSTIVNNNNATKGLTMDNPCWGGSEERHHDLHYLLKLIDVGFFSHTATNSDTMNGVICDDHDQSSNAISNDDYEEMSRRVQMMIKNNVILCDDVDYLVINKPPDLRMDGPHLATVHKLVTFLHPPPSLLELVTEEFKRAKLIINGSNTNDVGTAEQAATMSSLMVEIISKLSKHSDLKDNIIRPTHQLDYATSGVLLLAKSKKKASIACKAFEERTTKKEYLALVQGHIDVNENATVISSSRGGDDESCSPIAKTSKFPLLNPHQKEIFDQWIDGTIEKMSKKERLDMKGGRKKLNTFIGYMPTHSIFSKWKGVQQRKRKRKYSAVKDDPSAEKSIRCANRKISSKLGNEKISQDDDNNEDDDFWDNSTPSFTKEEEEYLLKCSWKEVKKNPNKKNKLLFEAVAKDFNDLQRKKHHRKIEAQKAKDEMDNDNFDKRLPTFFRVPGDDDNSFYVQIPLADEKDSFRVVVQSEAFKGDKNETGTSGNIAQYFPSGTNSEQLEFKPSLTKCVIQQLGFLRNHKVTKVLLHPRTGRR